MPPAPSDKPILIVDDDVSILTACAESLMLDGYKVDAAESGEKAIEMIPLKPYAVVVTDLVMREVDGLGVLRFAKKISPATQVILLTSYGSIDTAVEAMKLGAYDYLTKPFDPHKLDVSVHRAFEHQSLLHEVSGLKEILRLYDATRALTSIREEGELLQTVAKHACDIANADGASLLSVGAGRKELLVAATCGIRRAALLGQKVPWDQGIIDSLKTDTPESLGSMEVRRHLLLEKVQGFSDITSSLSYPITFKNHLLAVLNLCRVGANGRPFGQDELRLVAIFANHASFAIENSRLFESMRLLLEDEKEQLNSLLSEYRYLNAQRDIPIIS